MEIGITTIVYNGYGKFLKQWLDGISRLKHQPKYITVVLGKDHGVPMFGVPNEINCIESNSDNMGTLRNLAVENTPTEWIMNLDVDDEVLPWAIAEFEKYQEADIIVSSYINLGKNNFIVSPKINKEVLLSKEYYIRGNNFMHGGIPFKRKLWEKSKYHENECSNSLFWIDCAVQNPVFAQTQLPCLTYNRREQSHSDVDQTKRNKRFNIINNYRLKKINETINL